VRCLLAKLLAQVRVIDFDSAPNRWEGKPAPKLLGAPKKKDSTPENRSRFPLRGEGASACGPQEALRFVCMSKENPPLSEVKKEYLSYGKKRSLSRRSRYVESKNQRVVSLKGGGGGLVLAAGEGKGSISQQHNGGSNFWAGKELRGIPTTAREKEEATWT